MRHVPQIALRRGVLSLGQPLPEGLLERVCGCHWRQRFKLKVPRFFVANGDADELLVRVHVGDELVDVVPHVLLVVGEREDAVKCARALLVGERRDVEAFASCVEGLEQLLILLAVVERVVVADDRVAVELLAAEACNAGARPALADL